jgi:hypothetical protein
MWTDDDGEPLAPTKFDPFELAVIAAATWCGVHSALGQGIHLIEDALAKHSNERVRRRAVAREMHESIEAITHG